MSARGSGDGPFRSEAPVVVTRTLAPDEHARAHRQLTRGIPWIPIALATIGIATIALGIHLRGTAMLATLGGGWVLVLALRIRRGHAATIEKLPPAREVRIDELGIELDAEGRRSFWPWRAVRGIHVVADGIFVDVGAHGTLALPRDPRVERALAGRPRVDILRPARGAMWIAIGYVVLAIALGRALPAWVGPPDGGSQTPRQPPAER